MAVFAGDDLCVRTAARIWTDGTSPLDHGAHALARRHGTSALFVLGPRVDVPTWTGGPLVWMLPERGPSQPELARLRTLASIAPDGPWIVVCVEPEAGLPNDDELAAMERAIARALPPTTSFQLGVVERSRRDVDYSLARFIDAVARA